MAVTVALMGEPQFLAYSILLVWLMIPMAGGYIIEVRKRPSAKEEWGAVVRAMGIALLHGAPFSAVGAASGFLGHLWLAIAFLALSVGAQVRVVLVHRGR